MERSTVKYTKIRKKSAPNQSQEYKKKKEESKKKQETKLKKKQAATERKKMNRPPVVTCYTDGSCAHQIGAGGWCAYLECDGKSAMLSGSATHTTVSRMEIMGVYEALRAITIPSIITIYSDSQYVVSTISKNWIERWAQRGWKTITGKDVANQDLWIPIWDLLRFHVQVNLQWVKGHNGDPGNELCNEVAQTQMRKMVEKIQKESVTNT